MVNSAVSLVLCSFFCFPSHPWLPLHLRWGSFSELAQGHEPYGNPLEAVNCWRSPDRPLAWCSLWQFLELAWAMNWVVRWGWGQSVTNEWANIRRVVWKALRTSTRTVGKRPSAQGGLSPKLRASRVRREVGYCWLQVSTSGEEGSRALGLTPQFSASSAGSLAKGKRFE